MTTPEKIYARPEGRAFLTPRPIKITVNPFGYADASVLYEAGNTKVFCAVTLSQGVPHFLKGTRKGWLVAEYAMLPMATHTRIQRDVFGSKPNGRSIEISRFIGRSLRAMVNLDLLGERTIQVDCDVLQADGGTRTACVTGASIALQLAQELWIERGDMRQPIVVDSLASLSVGVARGQVLVDLDYQEDVSIDADYNVVMSKSGSVVEVQGTREHGTVDWKTFQSIVESARAGIIELFDRIDALKNHQESPEKNVSRNHDKRTEAKSPAGLFSLKSRLDNVLQ